jgi:hypothetical protein
MWHQFVQLFESFVDQLSALACCPAYALDLAFEVVDALIGACDKLREWKITDEAAMRYGIVNTIRYGPPNIGTRC